MTKQQINKTKNQHFLALAPKKDVVTPPRKPRNSQAPKWFKEFAKKQEEFNKTILQRFDNLVRKNHLTE